LRARPHTLRTHVHDEELTMSLTELDERFSEAGATATPWPETERALEAAQLFWITTVRADGRPHVTPLVAVYLDGSLYFSTGADEQKRINLQTNPNVALTTGCNDWTGGLDIVVEGRAEPVTDNKLLQQLAQLWAGKWDGTWQYRVADGAFHHDGGTALVFRVTPHKVLAFGKRPFSHTRHRF
jgi:general stress protein 26